MLWIENEFIDNIFVFYNLIVTFVNCTYIAISLNKKLIS